MPRPNDQRHRHNGWTDWTDLKREGLGRKKLPLHKKFTNGYGWRVSAFLISTLFASTLFTSTLRVNTLLDFLSIFAKI